MLIKFFLRRLLERRRPQMAQENQNKQHQNVICIFPSSLFIRNFSYTNDIMRAKYRFVPQSALVNSKLATIINTTGNAQTKVSF